MATWTQMGAFVPVEMTTAERDADFPDPPGRLIVYTSDALGPDINDGRLQMYDANRSLDAVWQNFLLTSDDRLQFPNVFFNMGGEYETVTISGGEIAPTQSLIVVDTQGGAGTDDLDAITTGQDGDMLLLAPASGARTVVLKHGTGSLNSIFMEDDQDLSLTESADFVLLLRTAAGWFVIGRGALQARQHDHADVQGGSDLTLYILADGTRPLTGDWDNIGRRIRNTGVAEVAAAAPATPATGSIWLDTSTDATGTESLAVASKTNSYTATDSDAVILCDASALAFTITLPTAVGRLGRVYRIKKTDGSPNTVTVDGAGVETIDGGLTATLTVQYEAITIISDGTEWWIL